jgi:hypothetical protein
MFGYSEGYPFSVFHPHSMKLPGSTTVWKIVADFFSGGRGQLKFSFTRDDKSKISGFVFNSDGDERDVNWIALKRR